ncbi:MAG: hypothetical protein HOB73_13845 [Planctomycetaceae bacterium]|jgi:hypothetical protein|nr:hypothetical protein [Planctomycetaceae bacterium]
MSEMNDDNGKIEQNVAVTSDDSGATEVSSTPPDATTTQRSAADEATAGNTSRFILFQAVPSWMFSLVVHMVILVVLGLMMLPFEVEELPSLTSVMSKNDIIEEIVDDLTDALDEPIDVPTEEVEVEVQVDAISEATEVEEIEIADDIEAPVAAVEFEKIADQVAPTTDLLSSTESVVGSGVTGRGAEARAVMVRDYGGTKQSEAAVAMALQWIAKHQNNNGSWSFDHSMNGQRCNCSKVGSLKTSMNGATAMALLPFLGAGNTHKKGAYRKEVQAGLYYLTSAMKVKGATGDLTDPGGRLYSHGLAAITLCEAFAMTKDRQLMAPAQLSLNFIVYAQDPIGGGWRYKPKQAGDTSVVGWQLMALKSGHMGYLQVPPATIQGCYKFLDSVAASDGATYGYTSPGAGQATTAVGLLCRMYMGWKKEEPALQRGVDQLAKWGPSKNNMYFNYYATQVMRHTGGKRWDVWNQELRDYLVASQEKGNGHSKGSWAIGSDHGARSGGRLYTTTLATMILEVYYRHMPIYAKQAAEDEFPL